MLSKVLNKYSIMKNFTRYNPTKLVFGTNILDKLPNELKVYGKKVFILIGKGSVKRNGILDSVCKTLEENALEYKIFEGIKSNPTVKDADEAVKSAQEFGAEVLLPIGGGSVIDTAKAVAMAIPNTHSVWDFYIRKVQVETAIPILAILTLAATGTEMNPYAVLQNNETKSKIGFGNPLLFPKVSFLNPEYTFSVPKNYTAYGISDLIAHTLEQYFDPSDAKLSNAMAALVIEQSFEYGPKVLAEPKNYDYRANIMWLATVALNGSLVAGKVSGDWGVHGLEHSLSVLFDIAHGAGLSIVYPAWLKVYKDEIEEKTAYLAQRALGKSSHDDFVEALEQFFQSIDSPIRLQQAGIGEDQRSAILENFMQNNVTGAFFKLNEELYNKILDKMYESI